MTAPTHSAASSTSLTPAGSEHSADAAVRNGCRFARSDPIDAAKPSVPDARERRHHDQRDRGRRCRDQRREDQRPGQDRHFLDEVDEAVGRGALLLAGGRAPQRTHARGDGRQREPRDHAEQDQQQPRASPRPRAPRSRSTPPDAEPRRRPSRRPARGRRSAVPAPGGTRPPRSTARRRRRPRAAANPCAGGRRARSRPRPRPGSPGRRAR